MTNLENIDEWIDRAVRDDVCSPGFAEQLRKRFFDMGGLNDGWALECDQLSARLAEAEADNARLRESLKAERDAVKRLNERSATAEESARWLLYDAPGRPCTEVDEFVRERPWLNCLKSSKSSGGE